MAKYFGTDGIRRLADEFSPEFIDGVAIGLHNYAVNQGKDNPKVLLGGDTRESTEWLLRDFEKAFDALGVEYANVGVLPTPGINYAFYDINFDYAVDVTASHNPYTDNGIKVFERGDNYGVKLSAPGVEQIENSLNDIKPLASSGGEEVENIHQAALDNYLKHLQAYVEKIGPANLERTGVDFSGLKIGLDCANGATSVSAPTIFQQFGAETTVINNDARYGQGINQDCGSTHLEQLQKLVTENHLDFGCAFDGDGDRCLMVDSTGEIIDGDQMLVVLAGWLGLDRLATTVMANQGLFDWAKDTGTELEITNVGDQHVFATMEREGILIGGEQSGHIILPGEPMGDGVLTALVMTKVISLSGQPLQSLASQMAKLPQITLNVDATEKDKQALQTPAKQAIVKNYEAKITQAGGRLLVRPSGTERLIRITVWGKDADEIAALANNLAKELK